MDVDRASITVTPNTGPRPAAGDGARPAATETPFHAHLEAAATERSAPTADDRDDGPRTIRRGELTDDALRRQQLGAQRRAAIQGSDEPQAAGSVGELDGPAALAAQLEEDTRNGVTRRISQEQYEELLAYNHRTLGMIRGNWSQGLGLEPADLARGDAHRVVNYAQVVGNATPIEGYEHLHGLDEVPEHLQGPDGGPLSVRQPSPTYYNTGGGRYLPPEVSNSPAHDQAAAEGAAAGPTLGR